MFACVAFGLTLIGLWECVSWGVVMPACEQGEGKERGRGKRRFIYLLLIICINILLMCINKTSRALFTGYCDAGDWYKLLQLNI